MECSVMDRFVVLWPVSSHFLHANLRINVPKSENYVKIFIRAHSGKVFGFFDQKLPENPNRVESVNTIDSIVFGCLGRNLAEKCPKT